MKHKTQMTQLKVYETNSRAGQQLMNLSMDDRKQKSMGTFLGALVGS